MPTIEPYAAKSEYDPPMYAQAVKVNTYLTDIRHRADYGPVREEFFGKRMPAHTLVAVAALAQPEFLIEIEAVAVL